MNFSIDDFAKSNSTQRIYIVRDVYKDNIFLKNIGWTHSQYWEKVERSEHVFSIGQEVICNTIDYSENSLGLGLLIGCSYTIQDIDSMYNTQYLKFTDNKKFYNSICFLPRFNEIKQSKSKLPSEMTEDELRAILTTPGHSTDCKSCGAPKPCEFHP